MTNDLYVERLSALLDDELNADERREVEAHVATCATCRGVLAELRTVVADARALEPGEPPNDLWPAIAARIESERAVVLPFADAAARGRRFSFSLPQLAAASIALIMVSGASAWMLGRSAAPATVAVAPDTVSSGTTGAVDPATGNVQDVALTQGDATPASDDADADVGAQPGDVAQPTTTVAQLDAPAAPADAPASAASGVGAQAVVDAPASRVSTVADFGDGDSTALQVAQLERMLENGATALDPKTIAVLRRNLLIIDAALAEARAALETDPANPYLSRHYQNTMLKKLELLRQAGSIGRGVS